MRSYLAQHKCSLVSKYWISVTVCIFGLRPDPWILHLKTITIFWKYVYAFMKWKGRFKFFFFFSFFPSQNVFLLNTEQTAECSSCCRCCFWGGFLLFSSALGGHSTVVCSFRNLACNLNIHSSFFEFKNCILACVSAMNLEPNILQAGSQSNTKLAL